MACRNYYAPLQDLTPDVSESGEEVVTVPATTPIQTLPPQQERKEDDEVRSRFSEDNSGDKRSQSLKQDASEKPMEWVLAVTIVMVVVVSVVQYTR
jgi:hypothetical protein